MTDLDDYQRQALDIARGLVKVGVPVFVARADASSATGYRMPQGWQHTVPDVAAVDSWRPGDALCAVMGHGLDLLDFDPRNGSPLGELPEWPRAYAVAATPSGGQHAFIAPLRVGSRDGILPGVDVKGGKPDGSGRGFAFIAPTVRVSKVDGQPRAYVWTTEPDLDALHEHGETDGSGHAVAELVVRSRGTNGARPAQPPWNTPSRELVQVRPPDPVQLGSPASWAEVDVRLRALAAELAAAPNGQGNIEAARIAHMVGQYVGAGQCDREHARALLQWAVGQWRYERSGDHERMLRTIESQLAVGERSPRAWTASAPAPALTGEIVEPTAGAVARHSLRVDLAPWLDGTYEPLAPSRGVIRDDGKPLLYPGKWHTCVGSTGSGKSWLGVAHCADELRAGSTVAYAHFEETSPAETVARLLALGLPVDVIRERLVWLDGSRRWEAGDMAAELAALPVAPSLLVLDGLNAACTRHGQDPAQVAAVGWYREMFVSPATRLDAAVLSLGHPPKARDRQDERHGYGSTAWLDEVDGVGFRLRAHPTHPIRRGMNGSATLYSAKDRPGGVEQLGTPDNRREGWVYLGTLCVDDSREHSEGTRIHLSRPRPEEIAALSAATADPADALSEAIAHVLADRPDRAYGSQSELQEWLNQARVKFNKTHVGPALDRLEGDGRLTRDPASSGRQRGGQLVGDSTDLPEPP